MDGFNRNKQMIVENLSKLEDYQQRLNFIIERGKAMPEMNPQFKIDQFLVEGCISRVWLVPQFQKSRIKFHADADSLIVKGIIALLLTVYNEGTPSEILADDGKFLADVGVTEHLSVNRRNGLSHVLKQIHTYSSAFVSQSKKEASSVL